MHNDHEGFIAIMHNDCYFETTFGTGAKKVLKRQFSRQRDIDIHIAAAAMSLCHDTFSYVDRTNCHWYWY